MATIQDVAKAAGVSVTTVSNVLNNPNAVSEKKHAQVMEAIKALNYMPNFLASNLRSKKKRLLAIVVPELSPLFAQIVDEIITELSPSGLTCLVELTHFDSPTEDECLRRLMLMGISGVFLCSCRDDVGEAVEALLGNRIPIVMLFNQPDSARFSGVVFNNYDIAARAAADTRDAFAKANYPLAAKETMIVTGSVHFRNERDCLEGFLSAFAPETQAQIERLTVRPSAELSCIDFMNSMLADSDAIIPRAIFVTSESIAAGVRKAIDLLGREPKIVFLAGDEWYCSQNESMHGIARAALQMGQAAAKLMLEAMKSALFFEQRCIVIKTPPPTERRYSPAFLRSPCRLRMLVYHRPPAYILQKLLPVYEKQFHVHIECEWMSTSAGLTEQLAKLPETQGEGADLFMMPYHCLDYFAASDYLYPIDLFLRNNTECYDEEYPDIIRKIARLDSEHVYALPLAINTQLLFYRKDLFERDDIRHRFFREYGIELSPPKTWRDFEIISRYFTKAYNPDSPVPYGTTILTSEQTPLPDEFWPRQWALRGRMFSDKTGMPDLCSPQNVQALSNLYNCYQYTPKEVATVHAAREPFRILQNDIAMHHTFASYVLNINTYGSVDYNRIGCVSTPGGHPLVGGWMLSINAYSRHAGESYQFIRWLTSRCYAEQSTLLGVFNPQINVLNSVHCQRVFPWTYNFQREMDKAGTREVLRTSQGKLIYPRVMVELLHDGISKVLFDELTVEESLAMMNSQLLRLRQG